MQSLKTEKRSLPGNEVPSGAMQKSWGMAQGENAW
jgi:hypothetical protein